ncbi:MAG: hypothetical protein H0X44_05915 [Acidobacteria bacterium]|nr:hypothetical protein [Acidobacteriota bacterium]
MASSARLWVVALVLIAASAAPALAEAQGRAQGARGQPGTRGQLSPADIQDQFDAYAIVRAQAALKLTDEQFPEFVRRARELHVVRRRARVARIRLVGNLNQLLRENNPAEARLSAATKALDEHERTSLDQVQKAYAAIDEVLDARQRARFRVLEEQLERKKLDMLFRARQGPRR